MAKKITELPAAVAAALTQLFEVVTNPGGTPVSQKLSVEQVRDLITPCKVYRALINQSGENDPTVNVLENTLGAPVVWTRDSAGTYFGTLAGAFPDANKTYSIISQRQPVFTEVGWNGADSVFIQTSSIQFNLPDLTFPLSDGILQNASIELRVYP